MILIEPWDTEHWIFYYITVMHGIHHSTRLISTFLGTFPSNNCEKRMLTGEHNTPPGFVQQPTCFQLCSAFSSGIESHISCPCSSRHCSRYSRYGPHVTPHLQPRVRQNNKRYIKKRWLFRVFIICCISSHLVLNTSQSIDTLCKIQGSRGTDKCKNDWKFWRNYRELHAFHLPRFSPL